MKTLKAKAQEKKSNIASVLYRRTLGIPIREIKQSVYAQGTATQLYEARKAMNEVRATFRPTRAHMQNLFNVESAYTNLVFKTRSDISKIKHKGLRGKTWKDHNIYLLKN